MPIHPPVPVLRVVFVLAMLGAISAGCDDPVSAPAAIAVTSMAFSQGQTIPPRHTCQGEGTSVPLRFLNDIEGVQEYVIVVDDPDAEGGTAIHWLLYGLSPDLQFITDGFESQDAMEGMSSSGLQGFEPLCPPKSEEHRYFFRVYALDSPLGLPDGADGPTLASAMNGRIIGYGDLMGVYKQF